MAVPLLTGILDAAGAEYSICAECDEYGELQRTGHAYMSLHVHLLNMLFEDAQRVAEITGETMFGLDLENAADNVHFASADVDETNGDILLYVDFAADA